MHLIQSNLLAIVCILGPLLCIFITVMMTADGGKYRRGYDAGRESALRNIETARKQGFEDGQREAKKQFRCDFEAFLVAQLKMVRQGLPAPEKKTKEEDGIYFPA